MVADIERLENAARTAMGDYSLPALQAPASATASSHLAVTASKLVAAMTRVLGRTA